MNYDRLEFLGDALLNMIISEWLYEENPNYNEGTLTKKRSELVNKKFLSSISQNLFYEEDLIIGKSIKKNNQKTMENIFSDIFESILGAIFVDSNMQKSKKFIYNHLIKKINTLENTNKNYKGILIEKCHSLGYESPVFKTLKEESIQRVQFKTQLIINGKTYCVAVGNTKKNAEMNVAKLALKQMID